MSSAAPRPWAGRQPLPIAVACATVAAAAAALVAGAGAPRQPRPPAAPVQGGLSPVRAETIPLGAPASDVAVGEGAVWAATDDAVLRASPRRYRVMSGTPLPRTSGRQVAAGAGAVWASDPLRGTVTRIDPRSGLVSATIPLRGRPVALAAGSTAAWVLRWRRASADVLRLDRRTAAITGRWHVGGLAPRPLLVAAGASAWTVEGGALVRVGPGRRLHRGDFVAGGIVGLARGGGLLWASVTGRMGVGQLLGLDERTGRVVRRLLVGRDAIGPLAVAQGAIWIADGTQDPGPHPLTVVYPDRTDLGARGEAPSAVGGVAYGYHSVWTANTRARVLSRFPLTAWSG
jgi:hypothetical protein